MDSKPAQRLLAHYQQAGEEPSVLEKTYLSSNVLARMLWQRRGRQISRLLLPLMEKGDTVIDIGCGGGWYSKHFAETGALVLATDISTGYLRQTRLYCQGLENVAILQCDATNLPFASKSVDVILISEVLEHLVSPEQALADIKRVLKNRGVVLMSVPSILNVELAARLRAKLKGQFYEHLHSYTPWDFRAFARKNGLKVRHFGTCLFIPIPWNSLASRINALEKVYNFVENVIAFIPGMNLLGRTVIVLAQVE